MGPVSKRSSAAFLFLSIGTHDLCPGEVGFLFVLFCTLLWWEIYLLYNTSPLGSTHRQAGSLGISPAARPSVSGVPDQLPGVWRSWLPGGVPSPGSPRCVLPPSTHSRDTAAKCYLPSFCWTMRVSFPGVTTGPSNSGTCAAKSVRKFILSICALALNCGGVCFHAEPVLV